MASIATTLVQRIGQGLAKSWAVLILSILLIVPQELIQRGPEICLFKKFLGLSCWGCGMTRALSFFAHGEIARARAYHSFVIALFPLLITVAFWQIWQGLRRKKNVFEK